MDNLYNEGLQGPGPLLEEPVKKEMLRKRPSILDNIRERLGGDYNIAKHFKKNEKNLKEKVKFFEKKELAGQLRADMAQRLQEARELLGQVQARNPGAGQALAVPEVVVQPLVKDRVKFFEKRNNGNKAKGRATAKVRAATLAPAVEAPLAGPLTLAGNSLFLGSPAPVMSLKKRTTAKSRKPTAVPAANYVPPEFNPPPANRIQPQPHTYGHYSPGGTYYTNGLVEPLPYGNNSPQEVNFSRFGYTASKAPTKNVHRKLKGRKTKKIRGVVQPENWGYYERAVAEIEVPPIYHPLTGRELTREDDAIDILENTVEMLEGFIDKAVRRARTLKRQNLKKATGIKPKAGV
jgi:hypothetical protein